MKDKNNDTMVNFDVEKEIIRIYTKSYRMLLVSMNRKKVIEQLWGIENKNAYPNVRFLLNVMSASYGMQQLEQQCTSLP